MSLDKDLEHSYDLVGKKIFKVNSLSQKFIQSSVNLFTPESLIKKKPQPIDVDVYTLVSGLSFSNNLLDSLSKIKIEIKKILKDLVCYWVKPENLAVELCVFRWPNNPWDKKWISDIKFFLDNKEYNSFDLTVSGIQLHQDGCIIAKGYDNSSIKHVRSDLTSSLQFVPIKQSNWAHIPLGRILEPISGEVFEELKRIIRNLSDTNIAIEKIIDAKLIHETRWYMEKKEVLYTKKFKLQSVK
jgi:hypothetical protein